MDTKKYVPRWQGWWQLMLDVSPVSQEINSESLAKLSRKCSDASQTSILSAAWRSKKCRSLSSPQHSSGRLQLRDSPPLPHPTTEDPAELNLTPTVTPVDVHPIGSFAPHSGVPIAGRRRRPAEGDFWPRSRLTCGWKRSFGARFGDVRLDSKCQKPQKIPYKNWVLKKTWNQKVHCVSA